ncbi:LytR C-terminal domain-containing protein [candidate division TA06 bacterium]|uniref:LytR C-terminal domain-containing protein n=1 Tax=candidate division TA06 bacterium TaxID=2250710 RepID=A0A933I9P7_UNCT6|nr:LytR C-terminal domain-containing protein [candidate division TA06 bacterium]
MSLVDLKKRPAGKGRKRLVFAAVLLLVIVCGAVGFSVCLRWKENSRIEKKRRIAQIRVQVLNGTKESGLAQKMADDLRRYGFDVVDIANAENDSFPETVVVDRADNSTGNAVYVAEALKCINIIPQLESRSYLEVTVIIGKDYNRPQKKGFLGRF